MSIEDATSVDGLGISKQDGSVVLTISDHLSWDDEVGHFDLLKRKLGAYLSFIKGSQLIKALPEAEGRDIRIEIICQHQPTDGAHRFIDATGRQLEPLGIKLASLELPNGF